MIRPLVRLLVIPRGADTDTDGRRVGDDWLLATLGNEGDAAYYLTTDGVHASQLGEWPGLGPRDLGEWLVGQINAAADAAYDLAGEPEEWPAYVEPRPCPPPDAAWVAVDGREWATNGHILVPRDGEPFAAVGWRDGGERPAPPPPARVLAVLTGLPGPHDGEAVIGAPDGVWRAGITERRVCIGGQYAPLLRRGTPRQRDGLAPVAVWADAALVAVVMPRRAP